MRQNFQLGLGKSLKYIRLRGFVIVHSDVGINLCIQVLESYNVLEMLLPDFPETLFRYWSPV